MTNDEESGDPVARLWGVANATHNWMESYAQLVKAYLDFPNQETEMALRMETVVILDACEKWRTHLG